MRAIAVALVLTLLTGCRSRLPRPVDIEPSDMCGFCRMAISQKRFAAEALDADENAVKFDDIGCMLRYLEGGRPKPAAVFVMDYDTREWKDANAASFLRGSKVATPMGGAILAFGDKPRAESTARDLGGEVLPFDRLSKP